MVAEPEGGGPADVLVVGVAIERAGRVLAARRSYPPADAGKWEFPGGKARPGEDPAAAAVREIDEELGCRIQVTGWLHATASIREGLVLRVARAALVSGEPAPRAGEHDALRWIPRGELARAVDLDWLEADRVFAAELAGSSD